MGARLTALGHCGDPPEVRLTGPCLLALLLLCGCDIEVKPDSASGDDHEQAGAQQLPIDKLTDDHISADTGDNTDWKFFKVRQRGILELTIYWDNKNVGSSVNVRDRFGVLLDSRRHSSELEKDRLDLRVEPGTHFVELRTDKGGSVYTIEAKFQNFDHRPSDDVAPEAVGLGENLLDEPIPEARPMARTPRRRGARRRGSRPRAAAAGPAIRATITRVIPGRGKRGSVIHLNRGRAQGLKRGMGGFVLDYDGTPLQGGAIQIIKVSAKSAQAKTRLRPADIADRRMVKVRTK